MGRPEFTGPVERPRDRGEITGDYEVMKSTSDLISAGSSTTVLDDSDPVLDGGWFLSNVSVSVLNWDANADGNPFQPELVQYTVQVDTTSGAPIVDITTAFQSGKMNFDPLLQVPKDYKIKVNVQNDTDNDIRATAAATVLQF